MTEREKFEAWIADKHATPLFKSYAWAGWQAALESRVLAEREPVAWRSKWKTGNQWTYSNSKPYCNPPEKFDVEPVFTHPTPDDASLVPVNVWILPDPLSVREGAFEYSGLFLTRSPGVAERNNGERLYRKAAIDRAMQSGEEGK